MTTKGLVLERETVVGSHGSWAQADCCPCVGGDLNPLLEGCWAPRPHLKVEPPCEPVVEEAEVDVARGHQLRRGEVLDVLVHLHGVVALRTPHTRRARTVSSRRSN
jgi:hypothetical protein